MKSPPCAVARGSCATLVAFADGAGTGMPMRTERPPLMLVGRPAELTSSRRPTRPVGPTWTVLA